MKTTIEISPSLLKEAKKIAHTEGSTLKALVEEGLQKVLQDRKRRTRFKLRKVTFKGNGLRTEVAGFSWERIRDTVYEGRGS